MWAANEKLTTVGGGDARAIVVRALRMSGHGLPVAGFTGVNWPLAWEWSVWDEEKDEGDGNEDSCSKGNPVSPRYMVERLQQRTLDWPWSDGYRDDISGLESRAAFKTTFVAKGRGASTTIRSKTE